MIKINSKNWFQSCLKEHKTRGVFLRKYDLQYHVDKNEPIWVMEGRVSKTREYFIEVVYTQWGTRIS